MTFGGWRKKLEILSQLEIMFVREPWGEELGTENCGGDEIDEGDAGPHQRGGALLIGKDREAKEAGRGKIYRVGDAIGEDEESGEYVAGKSREKKI